MNEKIFKGTTVKECLANASEDLNIPVENLKYSILEEKKGLFKKYAIISINEIVDLKNENKPTQNKNGTIAIYCGEFIIKNPKESGKPAGIQSTNNVTVLLNGEKIEATKQVYEDSIVEVILPETEAKRHMNLNINSDKMEAYISITYEAKIIYKLKDVEEKNIILIDSEIKEKIMPPKFTEQEIKNELLNYNIKYGIIKENIKKCTENEEVCNLIIAKGKETIEGIEDRIEFKYTKSENNTEENPESNEPIDYKAIGTVEGVKLGQVLAILHPGKNGESGMDITGKVINCKNVKKLVLSVGDGCKLLDEYTVVASSDGKPSVRGSTFFVYKTHEINGDVELKTGNIKFIGDVIVDGSVKEGMKVEAGNSILVKNNVADSELNANGDIVVKGNVIHSTLSGGKEDVIALEYMNNLKNMKTDIIELVSTIKQLKDMNLIEKNTSDGELIKLLIETKFKRLPKTSLKVAKAILKNGELQDELVYMIKNRILDLAPLNIHSYEELNNAVMIIDNKISQLDTKLTLPVDVVLDYCQDSIIKSSGSIIFSGKGQYVSEITAQNSVIFQMDKGIARGGVIKAENEIKCKIVGSMGGVSTKLIVNKHGHIWSEVAYPNTKFVVGTTEYVLEVPSKNVHVFMDENWELIVDKLML